MKERIIELRDCLGLTLKNFGDKIGLSISAVKSLESGRNPIQERHIKLILGAFPQVSEKWLRSGEGDMFTPATEAERIASEYDFPAAVSEIFNRLVEKYNLLDPAEQVVVDKYIRSVIVDMVPSREDEIAVKVAKYEAELRAEASDPGKSSVSQDTGESIG